MITQIISLLNRLSEAVLIFETFSSSFYDPLSILIP